MCGSPSEGKLVVKHTFLEFVDEAFHDVSRTRSFTEGTISDKEREVYNVMGDRSVSLAQDNVRLERENERMRTFLERMLMPGAAEPDRIDIQAPGTLSQDIQRDGNRQVDKPPTGTEYFTTVMLRNVPNKYTREMLIQLMDSEGFAGKYAFVYLPVDFKTHVGLGYVFVDMTSPSQAQEVRSHFEGFSQWGLPTDKVCNVSWSVPQQQGLDAQVQRYRNSPVMHESVPESWKPLLFQRGVRVPFPEPTRKVRVPRIRDFVS